MKLRAIAAACLGLAMLTGTAFADAPSLGHGPQVYSKGQFMQLLAVETKVNPLIYSGVFKDVGSDNYYSDIVEGLVVAGIVDMEMAKDGEIGLDEPITNEEAVALMVRGLRYKKSNMAIGVDLQFEDKDDISPWALSYIEVAAANGLVDNSGRFEPQAKVMGAPAMIERMDKVYRSLPLLPGSGLMRIEFPVLDAPEGVERPAMLSEDYKLVFDDEFDGDSLNTKNWGYNYSWGHSHNHSGWCVPENVIIKDGVLTLRGENERHPDSVGKQYTFNNQKNDIMYTSGAVNTAGTFRFNYGYFEARMKMPKGKGLWPAWWMLKDGWPPEIDMLEILCSRPKQLRVNCHYGASWNSERSHEQVITLDFDSTDDFHTYGFEWTPKYMKYYVDGVQVGHALTDKAALDQCTNMYMLLNLAIDGWDGKPDSTTVWPADFQCDFVRVWQKNEY